MPSNLQRNLPNSLTLLRLGLAVAFFSLIGIYRFPGPTWSLNVALVVFIAAAITDALDGHLARRWNVVSLFGRVMDPVADKVLVIGALMFLAGPRFVIPVGLEGAEVERGLTGLFVGGDARLVVTGVYPWMVVVILTRELLVTSIRGVLEAGGIAFPAIPAGKAKMVLQSIVTPIVLCLVANFDVVGEPWVVWLRDSLVYLTVFVTIVSGIPYILHGRAAVKAHAPSHR